MRNELINVMEDVSAELEAVYAVIELSKKRDINVAAAPIKEDYAVSVVIEALKKAGYSVKAEEALTSWRGDRSTYLVINW